MDLVDEVEDLLAEFGLGLSLGVGPARRGVAVAFEPVAFTGLVVPAVHGFGEKVPAHRVMWR
ncbi:hypothetical protein [Streptomyces sp. GS7]|uniref:hypothetical protein n=1 Tax=Streptomyces sp. GS7 TaxID=2692234 RepID=UPI001317E1D1|nr:hypothetical protein [Streptomyces sp. GS7]QHC22669.1 hypothetical protein GR130_15740 [Streptomyces sp. GS7]